MELFRILPLLVHIIILIKFGYDNVSLRAGVLSKADLLNIKDMYYIFLYVLMFSIFASLFVRERRLRITSLLTGILAFGLVWFGDNTFTPEYNKYPLYVPGESSETDDNAEDGTE